MPASSVPSSYGAALRARLDYLITAVATAIETDGDIEPLLGDRRRLGPAELAVVRAGERGSGHGLALLDAGHEVAAVVTQPARPRGRGRRVLPSAVAEVAREQIQALRHE